jgi:hypothetical protein
MDIGKYFPIFSFARGVIDNRRRKKSRATLQTETIDPYGWTIVCISDTHSLLDKIQTFPPADIIIHAGDFSNNGELEETQSFYTQFSNLPYDLKVFVAGNHDLTLDPLKLNDINWCSQFEKCAVKLGMTVDSYIAAIRKIIHSNRAPQGNLRYLQDDSCTVSSFTPSDSAPSSSIKIYGSPWQPEFFDWAFNLPRGQPLADKWAKIPPDVDVLITHGPPHGILDKTTQGHNIGCEELRKLFDTQSIKPRLHIFGHNHEDYGMTLLNNI